MTLQTLQHALRIVPFLKLNIIRELFIVHLVGNVKEKQNNSQS